MTIHEIKARQADRESYEMDTLLRALSQAKREKAQKASLKRRTNAALARWGIPLRLV